MPKPRKAPPTVPVKPHSVTVLLHDPIPAGESGRGWIDATAVGLKGSDHVVVLVEIDGEPERRVLHRTHVRRSDRD